VADLDPKRDTIGGFALVIFQEISARVSEMRLTAWMLPLHHGRGGLTVLAELWADCSSSAFIPFHESAMALTLRRPHDLVHSESSCPLSQSCT
jgi:hypothetical protein